MWTTAGFEGLPDAALGVRRLRSGATIVIVGVVLALLDSGIRFLGDVEPALPPLVLPAIVVVAIVAVWWPWTRLAWRAWGWRLDDATFQTRSGVYTKVWKGVPRDRVQFVEVTAGPLQRSAGLATLVVRTAGVRTPAVNVVDLETAVAEDLRDRLSPESSAASAHPDPEPHSEQESTGPWAPPVDAPEPLEP
ncbi:MAG: PH domain-containing protein [Acidimicrobiia bacterium]|nr:PH domain-containing protein [Acidimicrobiia bacterium]